MATSGAEWDDLQSLAQGLNPSAARGAGGLAEHVEHALSGGG